MRSVAGLHRGALSFPIVSFVASLAAAMPAGAATDGGIVFPWRDWSGKQQLFVVNPDGSGARQLTAGWADSGMPAWSPDGRHLVYAVWLFGRELVVIAEADGSYSHPIVEGTAPQWSVTNRIAFVRRSAIWVVNVDGSGQQQVTFPAAGAGHLHPVWSPDGTRLAYVEGVRLASTLRLTIWTMRADGADPRQVTFPGYDNLDAEGNFINSADDANSPAWSSTGVLCFWSGVARVVGQIWTVDADGSNRRQVTFERMANNDDCEWSPDGQFLLFTSDRRGPTELWRANADGSSPAPIAPIHGGPFPGDTAWQPLP